MTEQERKQKIQKLLSEQHIGYESISEQKLEDNEYFDITSNRKKAPYEQVPKSLLIKPKLAEDTEDILIDMLNKEIDNSQTYFVMINKERRVIQPGEEIFNSYGEHPNKYLLQQYGFAFADNKFDSYEFYMRLDASVEDVPLTELVDFTCQAKNS